MIGLVLVTHGRLAVERGRAICNEKGQHSRSAA
jgi:hypothetical protein